MHLYSYDGPVKEFDRIINDRWVGQTYATTERKARVNLSYQYKRKYGKTASAQITLPGPIVKEG